jgi:hypothetical protein
MRVMMVVVMVLRQHENIAYATPIPESIWKIRWMASDS